jgi:UDP-N-acetylglucosamine:LPS N-acetylglucosamine transferase
VPLPQSNYQEQERNAAALVEKNAALILPQNQLYPVTLLKKIEQIERERDQLISALKKIPTERLANERLWELLEN